MAVPPGAINRWRGGDRRRTNKLAGGGGGAEDIVLENSRGLVGGCDHDFLVAHHPLCMCVCPLSLTGLFDFVPPPPYFQILGPGRHVLLSPTNELDRVVQISDNEMGFIPRALLFDDALLPVRVVVGVASVVEVELGLRFGFGFGLGIDMVGVQMSLF